MGIIDEILNQKISLEEGAEKLGYNLKDLRDNLINYLKSKNQSVPAFITNPPKQVQKLKNRQTITLDETGYIPTFEVDEEEEELAIPDIITIFRDQLFKALALQNQLANYEDVKLYLDSFKTIQKYIDQMAVLELEQKYSHKEQFDKIFKFMLKLAEDHPEIEEIFLDFLETIR